MSSWTVPNHLAFVRTGNTLQLYVNGELRGSKTVTLHLNVNNDAPFRIGGNHESGTDQSLIGVTLWELEAETRALDAAAVLEHDGLVSFHRRLLSWSCTSTQHTPSSS